MVKLPRLSGSQGLVDARREARDDEPGGSVRPSACDDRRRRSGPLKPGGTIVEPTSGNWCLGLAIAARAATSMRVPSDHESRPRIAFLRVRCRSRGVPGRGRARGSESYYSTAGGSSARSRAFRRTCTRTREPQAHVESTGPEIWRQTRPGHPFRRRTRHGRRHRHRPLPQVANPGADHRRTPKALYSGGSGGHTWSRASAKTSGPRPTTVGRRPGHR